MESQEETLEDLLNKKIFPDSVWDISVHFDLV